MNNMIFDKTEKGREEIATRKYKLAARLRPLLVMVDGKQTGQELLKKVAGLGLTETSISELLREGYVQPTTVVAAGTPNTDTGAPGITAAGSAPAPTPSLAPAPAPVESILPEGQSQFEAIYRFYTETIKSTIGLRGYGLQLKVERAASVDDFRALRRPYLEAVLKAKGNEMARSVRARLDQLLYLGEDAGATLTSLTVLDVDAAE